jgi:hypothetical protein
MATLVLALVLGAWVEPAHAWAPAKGRGRVVDERVEPETATGAGEGAAPETEAGAGEGVAPPTEPDASEAGVEPGTDDEADGAGTEPTTETDAGEDVVDPEPTAPTTPARDPSATNPPSTHDVPADDFETESGLAPGGYYGHGVILERPPPDGRNRIIVGSILVPLGAIATISSAVGTWMTVPSHCAERLSAAGIEATASKCQGLFTFNVIRVSYGALMLGSGATILALGMIQRERYRKWRHEHGMQARLEPTIDLGGRGASLGLRLRF